MSPLGGIRIKITIKQEIYKHTHKNNVQNNLFFWWLLLCLHFSWKKVAIDERKGKKHLKNKSMTKILWKKKKYKGTLTKAIIMEFYFEILINTTKDIKINQQLLIFNQWIVGKQFFQITIMCDYGYNSIGQLDSQRSIPDPKCGNVTSTPQTFTFGPQFLVVQTQTFIDENFCFPGQVHRFRF